MNLDYIIRSYQAKDQEAVREICADTGFLGNPIDTIFSDRELFADIFTNHYLKKEPEHSFVAEVDNQVVGYLMSSLNKKANQALKINAITPSVNALYKQLTGQYQDQPQNKDFIEWLFFRANSEIPEHPNAGMHAHFNIRKNYRDQSIGQELIGTMIKRLKPKAFKRGIDKLYLEVFSHNGKNEEYFKQRNFKTYDRKRSTLFKNQLDQDIDLICIWQYLDLLDKPYQHF